MRPDLPPLPNRVPTPPAIAILFGLAFTLTAAADDHAGTVEPPRVGSSVSLAGFLAECDRLVADERLLEARNHLALALSTPALAEKEREQIRPRLEAIHRITFFSPRVVPGDPFTDRYVVEPGDTLARIAARLDLGVDWRLLRRINDLGESGRVQAFESIKVVRGPFHARVSRSDFRLDLYAGAPEHPERWLYVRSFPVGLGEGESTPAGTFVVKSSGKVTDPFWTDPRTGTWYAPGAEDNPIGDRWIGLEGIGESAALSGYGLHGTVEPASIGEARSMGCVRLLPEDVHLVFELLTEDVSRVSIVP